MKPSNITLLVLIIVFGTPSVASANVGTLLMWATMFHMFLGNALVGALEAALLTAVYRVPGTRTLVLMILANYFSAWVGWMWLADLSNNRNDIDLYNANRVLWVMIAAAYAATLVLEWPFVTGCLWPVGHRFRRSLAASLLVQSVSYAFLFGWYGLPSVNSLLTKATIVSPDQIALPAGVRIYYIADENGDVYTRQLGTGPAEKVFDLNSTDLADCLSFEDSKSKPGFRDITVSLESQDFNNPKNVRLGVFVANEDCPVDESRRSMMRSRFPSPSMGTASKLGSASESPWSFKAGFWPAQGLWGENSKTGEQVRVALEMPFIQWAVRHAIVLPGDCVLFQLGKRQICIFEPETRNVAVLCYGRGAVAVLDGTSLSVPGDEAP